MKQSDFLMNIIDEKNLINENTLNFKEKDYAKIIDILSIICKSIEIIPEIVFERIELLDDEYENDKMMRNIPIENSRLIKLRIHFRLIDEDGNSVIDEKTKKELKPTIDLLIPRLIDDSFLIYDVTYYPMLQILDYKSLVKDNTVTIKTLINKMRMEIKKSRKKVYRVELELFKRKDMPLWLVLFSLYSPLEAMKRVFRTNDIKVVDNIDNRTIDDLAVTEIMIGNKILQIEHSDSNNKDCFVPIDHLINKDDNKKYEFSIRVMLDSLKEFFYDKNASKFINKYVDEKDHEDLFISSDEFIEFLGSYYSTNVNKQLTKGKNVCHSLNRFLDDISKSYMEVEDMLDMYIKEIEKINEHNIAIENSDEKTIEFNMANNLLNKRVRMSEYIIFPFTKKLSENMHSILNGNSKDNIRINKIQNIFKIDKNIIIKYLLTNNLVRYNDQSNQMSAIASTKASFVTSESTENISDTLRNIHRTAIGRIDTVTTSTGDSTGLTFNLSATNKNLFDSTGKII